MDLQMKLAADGLAAVYKSPESGALPEWAHWKDMVYATTFEPIAIVYNKRLVPAEDVPKTHADFTKLLTTKADKYQKKVTTYDAEKSGRRLHARQPGRQAQSRVLGPGQGDGRARRSTCKARPAR